MAETKKTTLFSLETLKSWIKVTGIDDSEDARLIIAADGATEELEKQTGVYFVQRSLTEVWSGDGKCAHALMNAPVISIDIFTINGSAVDASSYVFDEETGIITFTASGVFCCGVKNIVVTYTAGYDIQDGDGLPSDVYRAGVDLAKAIYDELAVGAIAATSVSLGASTMVIKPSEWPQSVQRVIKSYAGTGNRP